MGHNILSECDQVLQKLVFLLKICDKMYACNDNKIVPREISIIAHMEKKEILLTIFAAVVFFLLTCKILTLRFICCNIDTG